MVKRKISRTAAASRNAKSSNRVTRTAPKRTTPKGSATRRTAPKKKKTVAKKRPSPKATAPARKPATGKTAVKRKGADRPAATLGRPKIPGTAELNQMFLKDYEARQVFEFLGVKTVKELEEHPPQEILDRLTGPLVQTVDRIRKALAVNNRYLAGDQQFAIQFCQQIR